MVSLSNHERPRAKDGSHETPPHDLRRQSQILYEGPEPGTLVQYFKDDTTAFDATKRATIEGKGVLNNRISEYLDVAADRHRRADPFRCAGSTCANSWSRKWRSSRSKWWCAISRRGRSPSGSGSRRARCCRARSSNITTRKTSSTTRGCREEHITAFGWANPQDLDDIVQSHHPHQRFPVGPLPRRQYQARRFQGRVSGGCGRTIICGLSCRRDQPGFPCRLWDVSDQREAGQGPLPPRIWAAWSKPIPKSPAASASCRNPCRASRRGRFSLSDLRSKSSPPESGDPVRDPANKPQVRHSICAGLPPSRIALCSPA